MHRDGIDAQCMVEAEILMHAQRLSIPSLAFT